MKTVGTITLLGALVASVGFAQTPAGIKVDGRGLPTVEGILRDTSKAHYGFVNFVAFGPGWSYTAQDYAAKEHRKEAVTDATLGKGLLHTGKIWAGGRGLAIREEFYDVSKDGRATARVKWTIASLDGKPMGLERAYLRFPLSRAEFAGGTVGGGTLPEAYEKEWIGVGDRKKIEIASKAGDKRLYASVRAGNAVVQDARKDKQDRFELRIEFPDVKTATSATVEFDFGGAFAASLGKPAGKVRLDPPPPPVKREAGKDWCVFPWTNEIRPGSILDFSRFTAFDAPAGRHGFVQIGRDGRFFFGDRPGKPVRFVGGNLCFDANFPSKEEARRVVRDFKLRGWNTVRFHHIDVTITKDEWKDLWSRTTYPEISPARLDRLDYLMAEFKKAGVYVTFDLYAMGGLGSCEGFDKPLNSNTIKAVVPIHKPAEDLWFRRAMEIFDHVNPYTGLKWKDDPAVLFVTLMNEDSIASVWWGASKLYIEKYKAWAKAKGYAQYEKDYGQKREFAEFLAEVKAEANRRMSKRLRDAGVRTFMSGGNWWDTTAQTYERETLDVVDNHQYGDHPQGGGYQKLPFRINQTSNVKASHPTYATPIMMAPTRVWGKPFTVTEYNYCLPNKWRAEGGLMTGAYAALQDWDALYRFAWSHAKGNMFKPSVARGFDVVTDPLSQMTERQIVLLFGRGDVKPAKKAYAYGVTRGEAFEKGLGDMWAKGLFPHPFTQLAYVSRVGSFVADGGAQPKLPCDEVYTRENRGEIAPFAGRAVSDTREVAIDMKKGRLAVNAPKTAGVCAVDRGDMKAGPLAVSGATTFCSVSASAMDDADLMRSRKVLVLHLTDVTNTDMTFANDRATQVKAWGALPYLAKTGEAKISLASEIEGLKVYALAPDGSRLRTVKSAYADGRYAFTAKVAAGEGADAPTMMYELGE